ncbi:MAG: NAD-dependent 4,6-dehydratase LegB [Thermodesulfovibrionales bacterium]|nr:NAD-dependent 4,6-dehydratase LegB [Thermodesulfovibrionales bacterium]
MIHLNGKKILITGADGFIGSHLTELLVRCGCDVSAFVYYNSFNSWGWLDTVSDEIKKNIELISGDVRDNNCVRKATKGVDVVYHLAALIGIPFSYNSPDSYVDTNIKGTLNVLQAARDMNVERVVVTSTSEVYGSAQYVPIDEKHPLQGQSPYSATKIAADKLAESFYRSFDTPVVIARPFNTYGPRQSARAVIPTIITQILSGEKEIILGSLKPRRDLNYVSDICEGFIAIGQADKVCGREINMCSGIDISIGELVDKICKLMDKDIRVKQEDVRLRPEGSEVERLLGSNKLMNEMTGWNSSVSLDEGLKKTIAWFADNINMARYKADMYNI